MNLSVIVPCHNTEPYIQLLLDSFKYQILGNYTVEYIFVLDACTDNTRDRILKANLNNCKIIECNNKSCGLSRNIGKLLATGDYIWFIDSDDWLLYLDAFKSVLDIMYERKFNMLRVDFATTPVWPGLKDNDAIPCMIWQFIIDRHFIDTYKIEFSNKQPGEDLEYLQKILDIFKQNNWGAVPFYNRKLYFYNFGRLNSNMTKFLSTGKVDIE